MGDMAEYSLETAFGEYLCQDCMCEDFCSCGVPPFVPAKKHETTVCGGREVERTNKSTGQKFIGCSAFPKCKWSRSVEHEVKRNPCYIESDGTGLCIQCRGEEGSICMWCGGIRTKRK